MTTPADTTPEKVDPLREAAERYRSLCESNDTDAIITALFAGDHRLDVVDLAKAYLAEHPTDDDEPVTEEWLRSVGFQQHYSDLIGWTLLLPPTVNDAAIAELCVRCGDPLDASDDDLCVSLCQGVPDDPRAFDDNVVLTSLPMKPTRGQLRRLAAALGIALNKSG